MPTDPLEILANRPDDTPRLTAIIRQAAADYATSLMRRAQEIPAYRTADVSDLTRRAAIIRDALEDTDETR